MSFYASYYITDIMVDNSPDSLIFLNCSNGGCSAAAVIKSGYDVIFNVHIRVMRNFLVSCL